MEYLESNKENWDSETTSSTTSDQKCGEIIVQSNKEFYIVCTFCIIRFTDFEQFTTHYSHDHSNESSSYSNDPLDILEIEIEDDLISNNNPVVEVSQWDEDDDDTRNIDEISGTNSKNESRIPSPLPAEKGKSSSNLLEKSKIVSKNSRSKKSSNNYYHCDSCERLFKNETKLENHKKYDHLPFDNINTYIQENLSDYDSDNDESHRRKPEQIQQIKIDLKKCRYCDSIFKTRFRRIEHERIKHTGERQYKCRYCDKSFASSSYCRQHEKFHAGIKPHKCNLCSASFVNKRNLALHLRRHKGEKNHPCSFCEKKFFDNAEKGIHERTHTGEKPFQCVNCGKCFITSSQMLHHRKLHHLIGVEKPHICETCNKSFLTKDQLQKHSASHSDARPFKCEICSKAFKLRKALKSHEKIHSDVKSYICKICDKGFKQFSGLYCHMKSHGQVPLKNDDPS